MEVFRLTQSAATLNPLVQTQTHREAKVARPGSEDAARPNSEVLQVSQLNIITAARCVSSSLCPSHIMLLFPLFRKASFMC